MQNSSSSKTRTAFLTGATGAVGGALAKRLSGNGWQVYALHRPTADTTLLRALNVTLVEGDIMTAEAIVGRVPSQADAVFHVAGDTSFWARNNLRQTRVNVDGTRNIVEAALQAGVKRFIHTSTISAYGQHAGDISETTVSNALSSPVNYERTKWLGEVEVRKGIARGLDAVIVNPCAIMGAGFTGGWVALFHQIKARAMKVLPPGDCVVNHLDAVVTAHIAAFERGRTGENYILAGDTVSFETLVKKAASIMEFPLKAKVAPPLVLMVFGQLAALAARVTGKEPLLTPEMASLMSQKMRINSQKAQTELGYQEEPWEKGLSEMYLWALAQGIV